MLKKFRKSVMVRNIYVEAFNILQAIDEKAHKKHSRIQKKYLQDAMMTSIAGICSKIKKYELMMTEIFGSFWGWNNKFFISLCFTFNSMGYISYTLEI